MTATAGVWNQTAATSQGLPGISANPMANSSGSSSSTSSSSTDSATISASDFLTLLVTELQNQDPTASTDPNEYVNQLVSVNSLEQLININQTLTTDLGSSSSSTTSSASKSGSGVAANTAHPATRTAGQSAQTSTSASAVGASTRQTASSGTVSSGNLSVPRADPAAHRVATALNGQHKTS